MTTLPDQSHHEGHEGGRLRELSQDECWSLLAEHQVGRISYVDGDGPVIIPINYVTGGGSIWVRTASYNQLAMHLADQLAAFEIDHVDPRTRTGWSVLVRGRAEHAAADGPVDWPDTAPWPDPRRTMQFRIVVTEVSGRSLAQTDVSPGAGRGPGTIQRRDVSSY